MVNLWVQYPKVNYVSYEEIHNITLHGVLKKVLLDHYPMKYHLRYNPKSRPHKKCWEKWRRQDRET